MKKVYMASLCKNGLLGGGLYLDDEKITFCTGKVTVPARLRNLELYYKDMDILTEGSMLLLPYVRIKMKNGEEWKFVAFARKGFVSGVKEHISNI